MQRRVGQHRQNGLDIFLCALIQYFHLGVLFDGIQSAENANRPGLRSASAKNINSLSIRCRRPWDEPVIYAVDQIGKARMRCPFRTIDRNPVFWMSASKASQ